MLKKVLFCAAVATVAAEDAIEDETVTCPVQPWVIAEEMAYNFATASAVAVVSFNEERIGWSGNSNNRCDQFVAIGVNDGLVHGVAVTDPIHRHFSLKYAGVDDDEIEFRYWNDDERKIYYSEHRETFVENARLGSFVGKGNEFELELRETPYCPDRCSTCAFEKHIFTLSTGALYTLTTSVTSDASTGPCNETQAGTCETPTGNQCFDKTKVGPCYVAGCDETETMSRDTYATAKTFTCKTKNSCKKAKFNDNAVVTCSFKDACKLAEFNSVAVATCNQINACKSAKFNDHAYATCKSKNACKTAEFNDNAVATCSFKDSCRLAKFNGHAKAICTAKFSCRDAKFNDNAVATCSVKDACKNTVFKNNAVATCSSKDACMDAVFKDNAVATCSSKDACKRAKFFGKATCTGSFCPNA